MLAMRMRGICNHFTIDIPFVILLYNLKIVISKEVILYKTPQYVNPLTGVKLRRHLILIHCLEYENSRQISYHLHYLCIHYIAFRIMGNVQYT